MGNIEEYRQEINNIDSELARLFKARMNVSESIARYKMEYGLPIKDASREEQIYAKCAERIADPKIEPYYVEFQKNVIDLSCRLQSRIMEGARVAYSGVEGAYAYIAAKKMFPDAQLIAYPNFEPAYEAVVNGEADFVVLPLENSYAGDVGAVMDLAFSGPLHVNRVRDLDIEHNLLVLPGTRPDQIKTVVSHSQALQQCDEYIKEHGYQTREYSNTARAAMFVRDSADPSVAAIASADTAQIFGLEILEQKINTSRNNTSRFAAFSRVQIPDDYNSGGKKSFIIVFSVKDEAGSLAMTLDIIGAHRYNMKNLKSRPLKGSLWKYYFYIEAEGDIMTSDGQDMLRELSAVCEKLKLVGAYTEDE